MPDTDPLPVTRPGTLAEGPLWDARSERLLWVDILGETINAYDPSSGENISCPHCPAPASIALIDEQPDSYLLAAGLKIMTIDWPITSYTHLATLGTGDRANDGAVDPAGRYLIGTLASETGGAVLYQIERGATRPILHGATISNGLDWSADGTSMYYVDTVLERVDEFDYDVTTGDLSRRRTLVDLADVPGRPDGLTVDADGRIWVAMARGGGAVRSFAPDGRPDRVLQLPVPNATSVAFGGPGLSELYVTTSRLGLSRSDLTACPSAGSLFQVTGVDATGRQPHRYRP